MNGVKDAVLRMVRAYRKVEEIRKAYVKCGFSDDILFDAAGDIQDAVGNEVFSSPVGLNDGLNKVLRNILVVSQKLLRIFRETISTVTE